jgi:SAM-dependent methyltransferase
VRAGRLRPRDRRPNGRPARWCRLLGSGDRACAKSRCRAEFLVGELTATGLDDAAVDAILCVDAMQFAAPYSAGVAECLRVLRPGGWLALTGWQALDLDDEDVPARLRVDIGAELRAAGFAEVEVREMPTWRRAERAQWQAALAEEPGDDAAVAALRGEGERVLRWLDRSTRVLALARKR